MAMNLKAARNNANLSRKEVADALGIDRNTVANYENYITSPGMMMAQKMCDLYGCQLDDIKWSEE